MISCRTSFRLLSVGALASLLVSVPAAAFAAVPNRPPASAHPVAAVNANVLVDSIGKFLSFIGLLLAGIVVFIIVVIIIVVVIAYKAWKRSKNKRTIPMPGQGSYRDPHAPTGSNIFIDYTSKSVASDIERLVNAAGQRVMAADNAVRSAREDLEFARLQYSAEDVATLEEATKKAEKACLDAFAWLDKLNDATSLRDRESIARNAIEAANTATRCIEDHEETFQKTRNLYSHAKEYLDQAEQKCAELDRTAERAQTELRSLKVAYPSTDLSSIDMNPDRAKQLVETARTTIAQGRTALDEGDSPNAVANLELAERTLTQAGILLDSVMEASTNLQNIRQRLLEAIASISSDIDDVDRLAKDKASFDPLVSEARQAIDQAKKANEGKGDPLAALHRLSVAEAALDDALDPLREANVALSKQVERVARERDLVLAAIAEGQNLISSNRGAVSHEPRQLIAKARNLADNSYTSDPQENMASLRQARELTDRAVSLARRDIDSMSSLGLGSGNIGSTGFGGGTFGGGFNGGLGGGRANSAMDVGALILGGLISKGGGSSGGWGGFGSSGGGFSSGGPRIF